MRAPARLSTRSLLLLTLPAALFLWQSKIWSHAVSLGIDEAWIGYNYGRNLALHGAIQMNVGEAPVEGYTGLLWMVTLAIAPLLDIPPQVFTKALGGLSALGIFALMTLQEERDEGPRFPVVGALLASCSAGLVLYAMSGLETALFCMLVLLGAVLHLRDRYVAETLVFTFATFFRPEGGIFFGVAGLHRLLERAPLRELVSRAAIFASAIVPHFLIRKAYYGFWLPHTFYIKAGGYENTSQWKNGLTQLTGYVEGPALGMTLAIVAALLLHRSPAGERLGRTKVYYLMNVAVFVAYRISIGFDALPKDRHEVMVLPFAAALAAMGIRGAGSLVAQRSRPAGGALSAVLLALCMARMIDLDTSPIDFHLSAGLGDIDLRREIGLRLKETTPPGAAIATGEIGKIIYYAERPLFDLSGITDIEIGKERPYAQKRPAPLPLDIILARKPAIVLIPSFQMGLSRTRISNPKQLSRVPTFQEPRFLAEYRLVEDRVRDLYFYYYRRKGV